MLKSRQITPPINLIVQIHVCSVRCSSLRSGKCVTCDESQAFIEFLKNKSTQEWMRSITMRLVPTERKEYENCCQLISWMISWIANSKSKCICQKFQTRFRLPNTNARSWEHFEANLMISRFISHHQCTEPEKRLRKSVKSLQFDWKATTNFPS